MSDSSSAGDRVRVTGRVVEFDTGVTAPGLDRDAAHGDVEALTALGRGPGDQAGRVDAWLPTTDIELERVEGMLVTLRAPRTHGHQNHFQARYGQLTLGAAGRARADRTAPARLGRARGAGGQRMHAIASCSTMRAARSIRFPRRISTPTTRLPRTGDRVGSVTGVIDFGLSTHARSRPRRLAHPSRPSRRSSARANPRPQRPPAVGGTLRVAGFGLQNYFTTFARRHHRRRRNTRRLHGAAARRAASHCRGADNRAEFDRQQAKIVAALAGLDADAIGLTEIENDGNRSAEHLVDALNARVGAGTYASVALPPARHRRAMRSGSRCCTGDRRCVRSAGP